MKLFTISCMLLLVLCVVNNTVTAQITITSSDVEAGFVASERTKFGVNDSGMVDGAIPVDLGIASSSAQTLDFSNIQFAHTRRDTTVEKYYVPNNTMPGYSSFTTATFALVASEIDTSISLTQAFYFKVQSDAFLVLGFALHYVVPVYSIDTTIVTTIRPSWFIAPLPNTLGTNSSTTDTLDTQDGREINTRIWNTNGFGSAKFPGGTTKDVLRTMKEQIQLKYGSDGAFKTRKRTREIEFISKDLWSVKFNVDTTFEGGIDSIKEYGFELKTGVAGVKTVSNALPERFSLAQNYPNPFNPTTNITFDISKSELVSLKIYDILGREVAVLVNQQMTPGSYQANFDASSLPSGIYLYKLSAGSFVQMNKMMLIK